MKEIFRKLRQEIILSFKYHTRSEIRQNVLLRMINIAEEELKIAYKLVDERNKILKLLQCPAHGDCVPYAIHEIKCMTLASRQLKDKRIQLKEQAKTIAGLHDQLTDIASGKIYVEKDNKIFELIKELRECIKTGQGEMNDKHEVSKNALKQIADLEEQLQRKQLEWQGMKDEVTLCHEKLERVQNQCIENKDERRAKLRYTVGLEKQLKELISRASADKIFDNIYRLIHDPAYFDGLPYGELAKEISKDILL